MSRGSPPDRPGRLQVAMVVHEAGAGGGGVTTAVRDLCRALPPSGVEPTVFAASGGAASADLVGSWAPTALRLDAPRGPARLGWRPRLGPALRVAAPDVVHLHGLWLGGSVATLGWSRRGRPTVVSPHGMLDPWALRRSAGRKRIAWAAYEGANLRRAACLHALNDAELAAIRALGLTMPVAVVPNGVAPGPSNDAPPPDWLARLPPGAASLLFLGRIHPKKGLDRLIAALGRADGAARGWHLVVAGWDEVGHAPALRAQAEALGVADRVHFVGPQLAGDRDRSYRAADAVVLPSRSEGQPMGVLEAWAAGRPVLMTAACNLPEGFEAGAAVELPADPAGMAVALERFCAMPAEGRRAMGQRGLALAASRFRWSGVADRMSALYAWVAGRGPRPDFVDPGTRGKARWT